MVGKLLIIAGAVSILLGILYLFGDKVPFLGKLPGDFAFKHNNTTVYIPLATMLVLSVLLTIILNLIGRK